jgi:hypothetical protein
MLIFGATNYLPSAGEALSLEWQKDGFPAGLILGIRVTNGLCRHRQLHQQKQMHSLGPIRYIHLLELLPLQIILSAQG